ncbi:MAG: hypothetical protein AAGI30_03110 [Planctomycetota bacterium]
MATSPDTVNQVRNILRKLDRSIDDARTRRLGGDELEAMPPAPGRIAPAPEPSDGPVPADEQLIGRAEAPAGESLDRPQRARRIERPRREFR